MKQCMATTRKKSRCKRPAVEGCAGFCKFHFDQFPSGSGAAAKAKATIIIKHVQKAVVIGYGIHEFIKDVWEVIGPYISSSEREYFDILFDENASRVQRIKAGRLLEASLENGN
jgi:hypothetical protein